MAFFPSLKHNFIAYRFSKLSSRPDCHSWWISKMQSGFSKVYSNCCCRCSFEAEIIKISQSHKMYSNNIVNFQESTTILNACTNKCGNLLNAPRICQCFKIVGLWLLSHKIILRRIILNLIRWFQIIISVVWNEFSYSLYCALSLVWHEVSQMEICIYQVSLTRIECDFMRSKLFKFSVF